MNNKKELRSIIKKRLSTLTAKEMEEKSIKIAEILTDLDIWKKSTIILSYAGMAREVSTALINKKALEEGKIIGVPRMDGEIIRFHQVTSLRNSPGKEEWEDHPWGISEPKADLPVLDPENFTDQALLITPGLGFDPQGGRLGRGKGFYDRFITQAGDKVYPVGIGFSEQVVEQASFDDHDRRVKIIITD